MQSSTVQIVAHLQNGKDNAQEVNGTVWNVRQKVRISNDIFITDRQVQNDFL